MEQQPFLTPAELRARLNISEQTYKEMLDAGIPCSRWKQGAQRRFDIEKVMEWLDERTESQNREGSDDRD